MEDDKASEIANIASACESLRYLPLCRCRHSYVKTIDAIAIVAVVQARYFTYRLLMEIIIIVLICAMHTVATENLSCLLNNLWQYYLYLLYSGKI